MAGLKLPARCKAFRNHFFYQTKYLQWRKKQQTELVRSVLFYQTKYFQSRKKQLTELVRSVLFYQTKYFQSRKKQQTELVRSVLYAEADKKRKERENLQGPAFFLRIFS
jgi:hypothetical protein